MHLQKLVKPIVLVTIKFRSNVIMSTHCCPVHLEKLRPQFHEKIHSCAKEILLMNSKIKSIYEHFFALLQYANNLLSIFTKLLYLLISRVTSLEQLSLAEFSGE